MTELYPWSHVFPTGYLMTSDISLQSTVVAIDDQLQAEIEEDTVVLHLDTQTYYSLNPVAGRIWELLQEPRSVEEIRERIVQEYDMPPTQCEADLLKFLRVLFEEDLIEFHKT